MVKTKFERHESVYVTEEQMAELKRKPVLYDMGRFEGEEFICTSKSLYDYEDNTFKVPSKFRKLFELRRKDDLDIMRSVGMEWV